MKPLTRQSSQARAEAAWALAERLQQFGYAEICIGLSASQKFVTQIVKGWEHEGKIRPITKPINGRERKIYEVIPEAELKPAPIVGDSVDQMWTVMRKFGSFSPLDLVAHCAVAVPVEDARSYCRTLLGARYLRVVQKAVPGKKEAIYRLFNATGPRAPRKRRITCIVDDNNGTVLPMEEGQ